MCCYSSFLSFPSFLFFFRSIIVLNVDVYFLLLNCSLTMYFSESSESVPLNTESRHMERIESNGRRHEATIFTLRELVDATKNFSLDFHLGRGGFGCVYKAYLNDGQVCSLLVIQYTSYLGLEFQGLGLSFLGFKFDQTSGSKKIESFIGFKFDHTSRSKKQRSAT